MAFPFPPRNEGDDEEVTDSTDEGLEFPSGDQVTAEEQPSSEATPAAQLPPEAQGEVNGGPLGCCLGVTIGLMVSLSIAVIGRLYANDLLPVLHNPLLVLILLRVAMGIVGLAAAITCGYFGWKIGKRLYREYEAPVIKYRGYK